MTVSPTHVPGKKEYAWNQFCEGGYIAIGWLSVHDLSQESIEEIISLIREQEYDNEANAIEAFTKFLTLEVGDYVAVNNTNAGLFGIGVISSGYRYKRNGHDIGAKDEFYSHFRDVTWKYTDYIRREDIIGPGETGWRPFGTVGGLEEEVPPYIRRLIGEMPPKTPYKQEYIVPNYLESVIRSITRLRSDPNHKERAHESIVEDFFSSLGFEKHRDIKYRQGRVDISLWEEDNVLVIVEVKKDWNLSRYNKPKAVLQAYKYALDKGSRLDLAHFISISNDGIEYYQKIQSLVSLFERITTSLNIFPTQQRSLFDELRVKDSEEENNP